MVRRKGDVKLALPKGPKRVKVGFPKGATTSHVMNKAIWNHFGTRGGGWGGPIPERPFLTNAMRDNSRTYRAALKSSAAKLIRGETDLTTVMSKLGILATGDIQKEITNLNDPPNSPVTIARKGSSNPLIDSGEMRGATTWKLDRA